MGAFRAFKHVYVHYNYYFYRHYKCAADIKLEIEMVNF